MLTEEAKAVDLQEQWTAPTCPVQAYDLQVGHRQDRKYTENSAVEHATPTAYHDVAGSNARSALARCSRENYYDFGLEVPYS